MEVSDKLIEEIKKNQPFRTVLPGILKIEKVISLEGEYAKSGETFKLKDKRGKFYKLRYCRSWFRAREIERNIRLVPAAFPHFYGREGRFLLFDWIDGAEVSYPLNPNLLYQLGHHFGQANAVEITTKKDPHKFFKKIFSQLEAIRVLNSNELALVQDAYKKITEKLKIDLGLELWDIHEKNILVDKKGRLYIIDEEGMGVRVKGFGMAKPLMNFLKTSAEKEAFWKGYNEASSNPEASKYFTSDYQTYLLLLQAIKYVVNFYNRGEDCLKKKRELLALVGRILR